MHDLEPPVELVAEDDSRLRRTAALDAAASVHLRVRDRTDDELTALRQQLALCLSNGVRDIRVHVDEQPDLDVEVLRALNGVALYLQRHGGALTLVGQSRSVLAKIAIFELEGLRSDRVTRAVRALDPSGAGHPAAHGRRARSRDVAAP